MDRKQKGYFGENIALQFYQSLGFKLLYKNWTIRGGEIDLILENEEFLLFVEVKNVLYVEDISDYLTNKKINTLKKTIDTFLWKNNFDKKVRLDVVFVKNDRILRVFDNVFI